MSKDFFKNFPTIGNDIQARGIVFESVWGSFIQNILTSN